MMQYAFLGRSGLRVSRLCLGTMNFGMVTEEELTEDLMQKAMDGQPIEDGQHIYFYE